MFGVFVQTADKLVWIGNEPTEERARALANEQAERNHSEADFVLIIPVVGIVDIDGGREG